MTRFRKPWRLLGISLASVAAVAVTLAVIQDATKGKQAYGGEITMEHTYLNPMKLDQEWEDYGIGDPYVLRFNGRYYLYCSTKDWRVGIKAWSSEDLVSWQYEGLVTEEPLTEGAYAPEVVYWNGSFYMYTSPGGKGHYVLRSDNPTGPFQIETDNLGLNIDGSVFIDDDAKWYFTYAASGGIMASTMKDPYSIDVGSKLNTSLGHWTEGSMIIKRQDRYYMTYTGNHVFSRGYRVNYAVAHDSPNGIYSIPENNPIIISTNDEFNGLGHSATVLGPDMDSYYIVYHNLAGRSAEGPPVRMLNMDRLIFNGDKMSVAGPTHGIPVQAPALPVFHDVLGGPEPQGEHWEHQKLVNGSAAWISSLSTDNRFTAEFNAVLTDENVPAGSEDADFEALFSYEDGDHYRGIRVDGKDMSMSMFERAGGQEVITQSVSLPNGMDMTKHHALRIESGDHGTRVYWDGILLLSDKEMKGTAGRIGYSWSPALKPELRYTAFSNEANGSSDQDVLKQVPGTMEAIHGVQDSVERNEYAISDKETPDGSYAVTVLQDHKGLTFPVYVKEDGSYLLSAMVSNASAGARLVLDAGGERKEILLDPSWFSEESEWTKIPLGSVQLRKGPQWLSLTRKKGDVSIRYIESSLISPVAPRHDVEFTDVYGSWNLANGQAELLSEGQEGKLFGGDPRWSNYEVSFQLTATEEASGEASVLLRTSNESDFPDQVRDSFMGYELSFRNGRVILKRISYEVNEEMASGFLELEEHQPAEIKVRLEGAAIHVYANGGEDPIVSWLDPNAFLNGRVGLRTSSKGWTFSPLTVEPIEMQ
ncbi:family 43 glycosylhydrolase [Paenibacillus glucanolyticus]|uniref:family 43 glycosylhydrolase n=1 Tax=Paenibacillus glucanolyticus TaxID=59843 RepID=UPI001D143FFF|nr:family 43 glycosylhydrolase [Paenibacillus glucanolyticus]